MHRSVFLAFVSIFAVASVALAATDREAPKSTLAQAVAQTNRASSFHYALDITVARTHYPAMSLRVRGIRGRGSLFIHVRAMADALPGPEQSALLDGPFLYEGSPNGVAIAGNVRWLRLPVARIGEQSRPMTTMRNLSPAPLLHVLDEWTRARTHSRTGLFHGTVAYDDRIVESALSGLTGGIQFRHIWFSARIGGDGYVHTIRVTGRTADAQRTLTVTAHLYAFGRAVTPHPPAEGTFIDKKSLALAE
jgi:hypothetical protein